MSRKCIDSMCANCSCAKFGRDRKLDSFPANAPLAPSKRPAKIVRRDVRKAIVGIQKKYRESMNILA